MIEIVTAVMRSTAGQMGDAPDGRLFVGHGGQVLVEALPTRSLKNLASALAVNALVVNVDSERGSDLADDVGHQVRRQLSAGRLCLWGAERGFLKKTLHV